MKNKTVETKRRGRESEGLKLGGRGVEMAVRRRNEDDAPPDYSGNDGLFTVKLFYGGQWFTPYGNLRYEGGGFTYFDNCEFKGFNREKLEEMTIGLNYKFPFGFLFKPYKKHLNMGIRVLEASVILDDLRERRYREAQVYMVMPEPVLDLEWKEDPEALRHIPDSQKLHK
ncbi:hypothetical protein CsatB_000753 [Cannabis sativa]